MIYNGTTFKIPDSVPFLLLIMRAVIGSLNSIYNLIFDRIFNKTLIFQFYIPIMQNQVRLFNLLYIYTYYVYCQRNVGKILLLKTSSADALQEIVEEHEKNGAI